MKNTITTLRAMNDDNITGYNELNSILSLYGYEKSFVTDSNTNTLEFASNKEDAITIICRLSSILGTQIAAYHQISDGNRKINVLVMYKNGKIIPEKVELRFVMGWSGKKLKLTQQNALLKEYNLAICFSDKARVSSGRQSIEFDIKDCVVKSKLFSNVTTVKAGTTITFIAH